MSGAQKGETSKSQLRNGGKTDAEDVYAPVKHTDAAAEEDDNIKAQERGKDQNKANMEDLDADVGKAASETTSSSSEDEKPVEGIKREAKRPDRGGSSKYSDGADAVSATSQPKILDIDNITSISSPAPSEHQTSSPRFGRDDSDNDTADTDSPAKRRREKKAKATKKARKSKSRDELPPFRISSEEERPNAIIRQPSEDALRERAVVQSTSAASALPPVTPTKGDKKEKKHKDKKHKDKAAKKSRERKKSTEGTQPPLSIPTNSLALPQRQKPGHLSRQEIRGEETEDLEESENLGPDRATESSVDRRIKDLIERDVAPSEDTEDVPKRFRERNFLDVSRSEDTSEYRGDSLRKEVPEVAQASPMKSPSGQLDSSASSDLEAAQSQASSTDRKAQVQLPPIQEESNLEETEITQSRGDPNSTIAMKTQQSRQTLGRSETESLSNTEKERKRDRAAKRKGHSKDKKDKIKAKDKKHKKDKEKGKTPEKIRDKKSSAAQFKKKSSVRDDKRVDAGSDDEAGSEQYSQLTSSGELS